MLINYRESVFALLPQLTYLDGFDADEQEAPDSDPEADGDALEDDYENGEGEGFFAFWFSCLVISPFALWGGFHQWRRSSVGPSPLLPPPAHSWEGLGLAGRSQGLVLSLLILCDPCLLLTQH